MSAPQVSSALIDLFASQTEPKAIATYGKLESYLYGNRIKSQERSMQLDKKIIGFIILAAAIYYLKKK